MRSSKIDNYKVFLTYLVVLGHVIGFMKFNTGIYLNNVIYSFHMPAFILINGVLFKILDYKKIVKLIGIFMFAQLFYLFYFRLVGYHSGIFNLKEKIQLPAFHLWYLVAYVAWAILVYVLIKIKKYLGYFIWIVAISIVFIAAFGIRFLDLGIPDQWMTYTRIIVFAPFFILGYYTKDIFFKMSAKPWMIGGSLLSIIISIGSIIFLTKSHILPTGLLYGFSHINSFHISNHDFLLLEIYQFVMAIVLLVAIYVLIPEKKYVWTNISPNVTSIYLWHPIIAVTLINVNFKVYPNLYAIALALIFTTMIVYVLNKLFTK